MTDPLTFHQDGAVARLTIDRPDAGNMLSVVLASK